jgi:hypothetical protein
MNNSINATNLKNFNSYELNKKSQEYQDNFMFFDHKDNFIFETNNIVVILDNFIGKFFLKHKKFSNKIYSLCKKDIFVIMLNTQKTLTSEIFEKFVENNFNVPKTINSIKNK